MITDDGFHLKSGFKKLFCSQMFVFYLNSGFTKILCTPIFPLEGVGAGTQASARAVQVSVSLPYIKLDCCCCESKLLARIHVHLWAHTLHGLLCYFSLHIHIQCSAMQFSTS